MPAHTHSACDLNYLGCLWPCETVKPVDLFQRGSPSPVRPSAGYKSAVRILTLAAHGATNDDEIIKYTRDVFDVVRCDCRGIVAILLWGWLSHDGHSRNETTHIRRSVRHVNRVVPHRPFEIKECVTCYENTSVVAAIVDASVV